MRSLLRRRTPPAACPAASGVPRAAWHAPPPPPPSPPPRPRRPHQRRAPPPLIKMTMDKVTGSGAAAQPAPARGAHGGARHGVGSCSRRAAMPCPAVRAASHCWPPPQAKSGTAAGFCGGSLKLGPVILRFPFFFFQTSSSSSSSSSAWSRLHF